MPQALQPPEGERSSRETAPTGRNVRARLTEVLTKGLDPTLLEVIDESHQHAGHAGWRASGETHMRVRVVSNAFVGKSRIDRHRMVNGLAAGELQTGLHALAIEAQAPDEAQRGISAGHGASEPAR